MKFSEKLDLALRIKGLSQTDLSHQIGVSTGNVHGWISGRHLPTVPKLIQIADILGMSLDYLLRDDREDGWFYEHMEMDESITRQIDTLGPREANRRLEAEIKNPDRSPGRIRVNKAATSYSKNASLKRLHQERKAEHDTSEE